MYGPPASPHPSQYSVRSLPQATPIIKSGILTLIRKRAGLPNNAKRRVHLVHPTSTEHIRIILRHLYNPAQSEIDNYSDPDYNLDYNNNGGSDVGLGLKGTGTGTGPSIKSILPSKRTTEIIGHIAQAAIMGTPILIIMPGSTSTKSSQMEPKQCPQFIELSECEKLMDEVQLKSACKFSLKMKKSFSNPTLDKSFATISNSQNIELKFSAAYSSEYIQWLLAIRASLKYATALQNQAPLSHLTDVADSPPSDVYLPDTQPVIVTMRETDPERVRRSMRGRASDTNMRTSLEESRASDFQRVDSRGMVMFSKGKRGYSDVGIPTESHRGLERESWVSAASSVEVKEFGELAGVFSTWKSENGSDSGVGTAATVTDEESGEADGRHHGVVILKKPRTGRNSLPLIDQKLETVLDGDEDALSSVSGGSSLTAHSGNDKSRKHAELLKVKIYG